MKFFRKRSLLASATLLLGALALRAQLGSWVQNLGTETGLRSVFFRPMALPSGTIDGRRPPSETRAELSRRIAAAPKDATLYRLRASEDELALDFAAAEADWKAAGDKLLLADFYHRRLRPADEIAVLNTIATPEAFQRAIAEAEAQGLPAIPEYQAWIAHQPDDAALPLRFIHYLIDHRQFAEAETELASIGHPWLEEVMLAVRRGGVDQAIAVFDKSFQPVMPPDQLKQYFDLLKSAGRLHDFVAQARTAVQAQPRSLDPVARLFDYYENQQNHAASRRVLAEYLARKSTWTASELAATAQLLQLVQEWDQSARQYYALYTLPGAPPTSRRQALAGLTSLLLNAPDQPIRFGAGDLSLYKDIATLDPHPGFLNGILSLVLNNSWPQGKYDEVNRGSAAYFHRARASQLLQLFDSQFPNAAEAPALHAALIAAYDSYGENEGVIRAGRDFLTRYPKADGRTHVALLMADAFARQDNTTGEFALYDQLLTQTRESEYLNVLDRYVARLVALRRPTDALAVYRREIVSHPQNQVLYEKLAAFLDQRNLGAEVEAVYKNAAAQFRGASWDQKLARWYLQRGRVADFEALTARVARIFSGTELQQYVAAVPRPPALDAALYLQVNLYAHRRFPDNLTFIRNLLEAYQRPETADPAAYTQLLRTYWYYDSQMRAWLFESLSREGKLDPELAALRSAATRTNPAAAQFLAEGEAWRSHFESAAPPFRTLAAQFPGRSDLVLRAATLERSLGHTETAVTFARDLVQADPRDREALARVGDTLADRGLFTRAASYWNRIPLTEPGKPESYLDAATIFWDYYRYDDALRLIHQARIHFNQPTLFAYQAGAIFEGKRDYPAAIHEYVRGSEQAQDRLAALARMPSRRAAVDAGTASAPLAVRVRVLQAEQRLADLQALLQSRAATATSAADLEFVRTTAAGQGFAAIEQLAMERQVAINRDPLEQLRLRLALVRLEEERSNLDGARRTIEALYRENPAILGVVRATTDFYWRHKLNGQAIATLVQAAGVSNPEYRRTFTYEAARKATETGQFSQARQLLQPLLAAQPFDSQYLAAMADTFAQASDDRGLRDFYRAAIEAMKQAPLAPAERDTRLAGLRRGLIPALARLGQPWDAVDQYIQLVNHYPDDQGLIREAARFAMHNNLAPRLVAYYTKACADSPKDYRWPMVLGRLQTHFEDFDAAIAAYTAATQVRPDRLDLYLNRAALEERLQRFPQAEQTYQKVWNLTFQNAAWQEKIAEFQARQGRSADAVATLRKAYLEGRPERADTLLQMAARLESWGLVKEAGDFAGRAARYGLEHENTAVFARVLTRLRRYDEVLSSLSADPEALAAMAQAVSEYYTPREKAAFETSLAKAAASGSNIRWSNIAHTAGLYDLEVHLLMSRPVQGPDFRAQQIWELESRRMRFEELGRLLEQSDPGMRMQAAQAYATIGDTAGLDRVLSGLPESDRPYAQQYWVTIAHDDPKKLLPFAAYRNDAANLAIESGDVTLALKAVAARGKNLPPVWTAAYTALTSLYYWSSAPDATGIFTRLLGTATIGERLAKPVDRNQQLAGSVWFYYASRFGEYLSLQGQPLARDYLPAAVEADPAGGIAYSELADWYAEHGDPERAFTEYQHTLELDPSRGAPHDRIALLLWNQGRRDEAIAQWKSALAAFEAQQGRPNLQEDFWVNAPAAMNHIGERNLAAELGPQLDSLLRAYAARHARYRIEPLVASAARYHLVDFSRQPLEVVEQLAESKSLDLTERIAVLRRIVYLTANNDWQIAYRQKELAEALLASGDVAGAQALLRPEWVDIALRIALKNGRLEAAFDRYSLRELEIAARSFNSPQEQDISDRIYDFIYSRRLDAGDFSDSNFLGLAQIRLKQGDLADALSLLRRMQLVSGEPFEGLMPAADLLSRFGHTAEAVEFLKQRVAAVPWDAQARLQLRDHLAALVTDSNAPYHVRAQAAKTGATGGGGELDLLARGHITPTEAAQPYFYDARLAAAADATDAAVQVRLLLDAIAVKPDETAPLLPLFLAACKASRYELAHQVLWRGARSRDVAIARQMAAIYQRFDEEYAAEARLRDAKEGKPAAVQQQLDAEIADLDRQAKRREQNAARRPDVTVNLEQSRIVRPRIEK